MDSRSFSMSTLDEMRAFSFHGHLLLRSELWVWIVKSGTRTCGEWILKSIVYTVYNSRLYIHTHSNLNLVCTFWNTIVAQAERQEKHPRMVDRHLFYFHPQDECGYFQPHPRLQWYTSPCHTIRIYCCFLFFSWSACSNYNWIFCISECKTIVFS